MDKRWSLCTTGVPQNQGTAELGAQTTALAPGEAPPNPARPLLSTQAALRLGAAMYKTCTQKVLASRKGLKIPLEAPGPIPPGLEPTGVHTETGAAVGWQVDTRLSNT